MKKRALFIIKERVVYGTKTKAYGLFNSCKFVAKTLKENDIEAEVIQVVDNNCIDKHVSRFKPTHCFIEAIWVVPSKFEVLAKLHPKVNWIIRIHSMVPFLTSEGMAYEWLNKYNELRKKGIKINISCNNINMHKDMKSIYGDNISYTPNIYHPDINAKPEEHFNFKKLKDDLHIGCFGALRVLKNHTQQAHWAIEFADKIKKKLFFHVNVSEHEQREAGPVLSNLRSIFENTNHNLVEHLWHDHIDFMELVKNMDMGMQISFSETFNIVAADFVSCGIPIVTSKDIKFVNCLSAVNSSERKKVINALYIAYYGRIFGLHRINDILLIIHNEKAKKAWLNFFKQ
jgi:hypothetical protein